MSTNSTTVYARATDAAGNQSGQATLTVSNIDKVAPVVNFGTNGASNIQTASTVVTVSDTGGSAINASTLQYIWDTQNATTPSSGWTAFPNGVTLTRGSVNATYYLWVKGSDNAGNSVVGKSNAFVLDNSPPVNPSMAATPTGWTNGNVSVIITYPADSAVKEYSTNGTTWSIYSSPVTVTTNGTTVYSRSRDLAGNQSGQSTLTVSNIDRTAPSAPTVNFNGYTPGNWTKGNITISLSATDSQSGINRYQYSNDGTNWYDTGSLVINTDAYYWITYRAIDNAGNASSASGSYLIARDATGPGYTGYEVKNVSNTGYDIYLYGVSDSLSGINRIQFPTWTEYNGQDDLRGDWGTNAACSGQDLGNGTWYFRVNTSEHNNEYGQYITHIYLYDNLGNTNAVGTGAFVKEEMITSSGDTIGLYGGRSGYATQSIDSSGTVRVNITSSGGAQAAGFVIYFKNPITIPSLTSGAQVAYIYSGTTGSYTATGYMGTSRDIIANVDSTWIGGLSGTSSWPQAALTLDTYMNGWGPKTFTQKQVSSMTIFLNSQNGGSAFGLELKRGTVIRIPITSGYYYVTL
ncbi:GBS Bsp-like repeat protein [compost metagenome]